MRTGTLQISFVIPVRSATSGYRSMECAGPGNTEGQGCRADIGLSPGTGKQIATVLPELRHCAFMPV